MVGCVLGCGLKAQGLLGHGGQRTVSDCSPECPAAFQIRAAGAVSREVLMVLSIHLHGGRFCFSFDIFHVLTSAWKQTTQV